MPVGLICQAMPRSPSAESYRVVRANLDLARRDRDVRVVMVTGPHGGEGKSTVAANLAVALAQAGPPGPARRRRPPHAVACTRPSA